MNIEEVYDVVNLYPSWLIWLPFRWGYHVLHFMMKTPWTDEHVQYAEFNL